MASWVVDRGELLLIVALAVVTVGGTAVLASSFGPPFASPDESSQWLTATRVAEEHSVWQDDPLTRLDEADMIHFRFEVNYNGRVTTKYPILDPALSGIAMSVFGTGGVVYFLAFVAAAGFVGFAVGMREIGAAPLMALWLVPMIWNTAHVFAGMTWFFFFLGVAFAVYARSLADRSWWWFTAAALLTSIGLLARYQDAVIIGMIAVALAWQFARGDPHRQRSVPGVVAILGACLLAGFVVPQLLVNWLMFDDLLVFGELLHSEGEAGGDLREILLRALLPWTPSAQVIGASLIYLVVLLVPGSVGLAAVYAWLARRGNVPVPERTTVILLAIALSYTVVARANSGGYIAVPDGPTFQAINARYWYPVYLVLTIAAAVAVKHVISRATLRATLLTIGALIGMMAVWYLPDGAGAYYRRSTVVSHAQVRNLIAETESNAVIYTGATDKWVVGLRRGATWRQSADGDRFDAEAVVSSIATVRAAGYPIYLLLERSLVEQQRSSLQAVLEDRGLDLVWVDEAFVGIRFRVVNRSP